MDIIERGTIAITVSDAPDYSRTVSSAIERAGIRIKYSQRLKIFGRSLNLGGDPEYPLVPSTPLAADANTHLTDFETLAPLPIIIPKGYALTLISLAYTFTQDSQVYVYIDGGALYGSITCLAAAGGGQPTYMNKVVELSTKWVDPPGLSAHDFDIKLYNVGAGDLFGGIMVSGILEVIGTEPWPTTKECHCPHCGNKQVESVHATRIKCSNCGKEYIVYDLTRFRGTP